MADEGYITVIIFSKTFPIIVAKTSRKNSPLFNEYNNIKYANTLLENTCLENSIEKVIGHYNIKGRYWLLKNYINGTSGDHYLKQSISLNNKIKFLDSSINWLMKFFSNTFDYKSFDKRMKVIFLNKFMLNRNSKYYNNFLKEKYFLSPTHGDFVAKNILVDKNFKCNNKIIDLDQFSLNGFIIGDLMSIIMSTSKLLFPKETIYKTFMEENPYSKCVSKNIFKFCDLMNIELSEFKELVLIYAQISINISYKYNFKTTFDTIIDLKNYFKNNQTKGCL